MDRLEIRSFVIPLDGVYTELSKSRDGDSAKYELVYLPNQQRMLAPDPTIIVAIVGAIGTVLTTILVGLLKIVQAEVGNKGTIVIVGENDARVEVPSDTPMHEIEEYVAMAKDLGAKKIYLEVDKETSKSS
ncbi:hypothetical protein [Blastopirellula retiformator]|uniref:Uncharacterized protein n=1 Tax=Blastopirellula retiformator TaxID=2527970 RepID=A0A5C5V166_9BACT|nr:hypothetical protein [Blastopirellula retiformator]TWT31670.1 hypothetical protein Enr8_35940 [Blastopirellula retiformator]